MLEVGTKAPDFTLLNQHGEEISLSQYRGQKAVSYTHLDVYKRQSLYYWIYYF